jgi:hypothetical protein
MQVIRKQLGHLEETIVDLHQETLSAPRDPAWDQVRDVVSCLDSIADVIRQALDSCMEWKEPREEC